MNTSDGMKWSRKGFKIWQTWASDWRGHKIVVKNWFNIYLLGTGEEVYIDDKLILLRRVALEFVTPDVVFQVTLPEQGGITARLQCWMIWPTWIEISLNS